MPFEKIDYSALRAALTVLRLLQGVVTGTLLVTPNCLMFDPNVSDPLVLEHGADKYCVMVPMDYIVSAALYTDIAHMKVKDRGNIPL